MIKYSFRLKLIITVTILTVSLTSLSIILYYQYSFRAVMSSLSKNLSDVSGLIRLSLNDDDINRIIRLKSLLQPYIHYSDAELKKLDNGEIINNIPRETIHILQSDDDFQALVKKLKSFMSINIKSSNMDNFNIDDIQQHAKEGAFFPYIVIVDDKYSKYRSVQNLVSAAYEKGKIWPGNPIGNTWKTLMPLSAINQKNTYVHKDVIKDNFYDVLYASTPLYDSSGKIIAYLEVDYAVDGEIAKLSKLKDLSIVMLIVSFIVSVMIAIIFSEQVVRPVKLLTNAAKKIKNKNYDIDIDNFSNDEIGELGRIFNLMASSIKQSTIDLNMSNERLKSITADMHDGVGSILTCIQIASRECGTPEMNYIHKISKQGMDEVRFLIDAIEYENCDFELLIEGIEIIAAEILAVKNIKWTLDTNVLTQSEIAFQLYIDTQRIIRECLTNVIKHSDADVCKISLHENNGTLIISVQNNGKKLNEPMTISGGNGIANIKRRINKYHGFVNILSDGSGYIIEIILKSILKKST